MNTPKRHHILPRFYLNGFCRNERLWVFDRELKTIRQSTPANTCVKKHYYSFTDNEGKKTTEVEEWLALIEGEAKPIIDKINAGDRLTIDEKYVLSVFIGTMMDRGTDFEKQVQKFQGRMTEMIADMIFSDVERTKSVYKQMERETGKKIDYPADKLVEFHKRGEYEIKILRNASLELFPKVAVDMAGIFPQMDWVVCHAPKRSSYITIDNPFVLVPPVDHNPKSFYGIGIATPGAKKVFPVSQKTCLLIGDKGDNITHVEVDQKSVRQANMYVSYYTDRFLIGRDRELVENIVRTTNLENTAPMEKYRVD